MIPALLVVLMIAVYLLSSYIFKSEGRKFKVLSKALARQGITLKSFDYLSDSQVLEKSGKDKPDSGKRFFELKVIDEKGKKRILYGSTDENNKINFHTDLKNL